MTPRRSLAFLAVSLLVLAGTAAYRLTRAIPIAPDGAPVVVPGSAGDHVRMHMVLAPRDPTMPGPAPQVVEGRLQLDNDACEACHEVQAAQWRGSQHQTAYTEREFQRALAHEPVPFCRGCHAPEADPRRPATGWAADIGVGCVSCHVVGDAVLAADGPDVAAPHPLRRDPRFATAAACANCHQFAFPDNRRRAHPEAMQRTIAEHAASPLAATDCGDCHMRDRDGARSHAFVGSRDDYYFRDALTISAARVAPDTIEIEVAARPDVVGHAVPTGDLFRRLAVAVRPLGRGPARPWTTQYLARHYALERAPDHGGPLRVERTDDRPHPGEPPRVLRFRLDPADAARPVAWEVRSERVESILEEREDRAIVVGAMSLAAGELPPT
ncbi:multiheme c-type cytochrome [Nannocystis radixulma]|uniref:Multiheme c-type cytochrome n=1 Tax=Nannocystis radixulma TaxID=2995305 RepID=A0ABT5B206_9BACT|nr:multiheme c-type cytochrome [Nannocystis radixulma]MDC0667705.1 multiheme c-type cytochrome [Nannocystis radixulma]